MEELRHEQGGERGNFHRSWLSYVSRSGNRENQWENKVGQYFGAQISYLSRVPYGRMKALEQSVQSQALGSGKIISSPGQASKAVLSSELFCSVRFGEGKQLAFILFLVMEVG